GPEHEGLPFIQVSGGFTIGNNGEGELPQVGNSFQWSDNISKVVGRHSLKFGGDVRRQRFDQLLYFDVNGEFFVDETSTNSTLGDTAFSDYMLGLPGSYGQGSAQIENVRSTGLYQHGSRANRTGGSWRFRCAHWSDTNLLQSLCATNRNCMESRHLGQNQHPRGLGPVLQPY